MTSKIEDRNIKAALQILSSDDRPATDNNATVIALRARHPPMTTDRMPLPSPQVYNALQVTETELIAAIKSFPAGSAGGPDGIRLQHILDLTNNQEAGPALVASLTTFINMLLAGRCPHTVIPVFFWRRSVVVFGQLLSATLFVDWLPNALTHMHCTPLAPNCYPNSSVSAHLEVAKLLFTRQDVLWQTCYPTTY